jgi:hypothetical protein
MKTHLRIINRTSLNPEFRVACGAGVSWTKHTTSDQSKVNCNKCLGLMANQQLKEELKMAALLTKAKLINDRNSAILPTGEIVAKGTPGAIDYKAKP